MSTDANAAGPDLPEAARRIRRERQARGWSQRDAVQLLRAHGGNDVSSAESLLRTWKRWEAGEAEPDAFHKPLIAKTFGTVTSAMFPPDRPRQETQIPGTSGMGTLEVLARLRSSDVSGGTLDALRATVDHLCSQYPHMPSDVLLAESHEWLRRVSRLRDNRLTLGQHREVLTLAGYLALLVGCLEYDMSHTVEAEVSRQAALSLGTEAGHSEIVGWAYEMEAWYALTGGDYQRVIAASRAGQAAAPTTGAAVQLSAQRAKAWARLGDRRQVELALDDGRTLLEGMPDPSNRDHHFVVDPSKYDFYAMDCYKILGENQLAQAYAEEVIRAGTTFDGEERSPMRIAEARLTLGVVAAREGEVEAAVHHGRRALVGPRRSLPSLLMCSRELASILRRTSPDAPGTVAYVDELGVLSAGGRPSL